ncbi:patatin-like phospholipase family protein [Chitiniphilus purpureus]|uniref:Patatin-like phospholipase family protein n=1 Tax=Chitiniphilus purpureus TaxID=2981137 RepID=A0ABY6DI47_9NEIS|nr:patatin-like phospholipase family protein [Chitiniphilus sp. CD1]UXY13996.1 patatin-like phospholipase family protein [Chitiniphilus sp. CD1]
MSKIGLGLVWMLLAATLAAVEPPRPRIGVVMGGGGARGLAHIGVLKVLEEAQVPIDCIVGTSMGALVAGSYAVGRSADELTEQVGKAVWDDLLSSDLPRQLNSFRQKQADQLALLPVDIGVSDEGRLALPKAAINTQKVERFLRELTYHGTAPDFDALPVPYRAIATDLETGEMVVMRDGDLVSAMRASMAVPGVFPPVLRNERLLADGGLSRNLGVDVARELCADVVIVVDVASPPLKRQEISDIFSVADQYTRLMIVQNQKPQIGSLTELDVLITPDLADLGSADFVKGRDFVVLGERAARKALVSLQRYALPAPQYQAWQAARAEKRLHPKPIVQVAVGKLKHVNPAVMEEALDVQTGAPLDSEAFNQRLAGIYARGDFAQLDYTLSDHGSGQRLTITPIEKDWGPNYLNFGLALGTDFERSNPYSLTARYRRTWINPLGAEFQALASVGDKSLLAAEFYQPLQVEGYAFVAPHAGIDSSPLAFWENETLAAEYSYHRSQVGLDLGSSWTRYGEVRLGPVVHHYRLERQVGPAPLPDLEQWDWGIRFNLFYDQLDNLNFPRSGTLLHLYGYEAIKGGIEAPGAEAFSRYGRYGFEMTRGFSVRDYGGHVAVRGQMPRNSGSALSDVRWLGGFLNLSSYHYQQLIGDKFFYGRLALYRPVDMFSEHDKGTYLGAALETGKMFSDEDRVGDNWHFSLVGYLGIETLLGPLYLGVAYGDNHQTRLYVTLGNPF